MCYVLWLLVCLSVRCVSLFLRSLLSHLSSYCQVSQWAVGKLLLDIIIWNSVFTGYNDIDVLFGCVCQGSQYSHLFTCCVIANYIGIMLLLNMHYYDIMIDSHVTIDIITVTCSCFLSSPVSFVWLLPHYISVWYSGSQYSRSSGF